MNFEKWFQIYAPTAPESLDDCAFDSFQAGAASRDAEIAELTKQLDDLLKQVESIAFRIANKEYGHAALACEEVIANYQHGSLGEDVGAEGGA